MAFNWNEADEKYKSKSKYAEEGTYEVFFKGVEIKEVGTNGSIIMNFQFEDADGDKGMKYPNAGHWLSVKNEDWRCYHNRNLLMVLGVAKDAAQKAIEAVESSAKNDPAKLIEGYSTLFGKAAAKKPKVEIEVYRAGKYTNAEFTDRSVAMPHDDGGSDATSSNGVFDTDAPEVTAEEPVDLSEIPF